MPLYLIASFAIVALEAVCTLIFLEGFFRPRITLNFPLRALVLTLLLFLFITVVEIFAPTFMTDMMWKILVYLLLYSLFFMLLYDGPAIKKLILVGIWMFLSNITNIITILFCRGAFTKPEQLALQPGSFPISLLAKLVLLLVAVLVRVWVRRSGGQTASLNSSRWLVFLFLPVLSILTIAAALEYYDTGRQGRAILLLLCFGWLAVNLLAFRFLQMVDEREQRWVQSRQMRRIASAEVKSLEAVTQANRRQRQLTHDFENHLVCIQNLMLDAEFAKALDYVQSIAGGLQKDADHAHTGHPVVDTVLNQKIAKAAEKNINLASSVSDLSGLPMADDDLTTILANLLDNAIEACEKLKAGRVITLKLVQEDGSLVLSVKNPVAKPVHIEEGSIVTSKADGGGHGQGIQSIKTALDKYDSSYAMRCENGHFVFSAMVDF